MRITRKIKTLSPTDFDVDIHSLIQFLQSLPSQYPDYNCLRIEWDPGQWEDPGEFNLVGDREEREGEKRARLAKEKKIREREDKVKRKVEDKEKKELARLSKKYGVSLKGLDGLE